MLKKIKRQSLTILSVVLVIAGIMMYTYPIVINILNGKFTEHEIDNLKKVVQSMKQQQENNSTQESGDIINATDTLLTPLDELLQQIKDYNQSIYKQGQSGLVDAFSYEQSSIDLSKFGIMNNMFGYIEIPSIDIKLGIYLGANRENMTKGAVHLSQTSLPIGGTNTNAVIAAHRGTNKNGDMFRNIDKIEIGDKVYITNAWETLIYKAKSIVIIKPDEISKVLIQEGKDMITLISCNPYGHNYQRYVVYCERVTEEEKGD